MLSNPSALPTNLVSLILAMHIRAADPVGQTRLQVQRASSRRDKKVNGSEFVDCTASVTVAQLYYMTQQQPQTAHKQTSMAVLQETQLTEQAVS